MHVLDVRVLLCAEPTSRSVRRGLDQDHANMERITVQPEYTDKRRRPAAPAFSKEITTYLAQRPTNKGGARACIGARCNPSY
jgi:hypothetical protein